MVNGVATVWLPVTDMDRAVGFYRDVLGLSVSMTDPQWSEVEADGLTIGLNARETAGGQGGAVISFRPESADLETEVATLTDAGVRFTGQISDHDWGRIAPFQDSEGNDLQLYAPPKG